jgi:hypothetical protein
MTNVYKIEVAVVDYDDLGESGITRLIEGLRTPYTVLSYITNIQKAWVDDPDSVGRRQLVEQKLPELFSPWLPITTAPSKEYVLVYHPDYGVTEAIFDPEEVAIQDNVVDHVWVSSYCEDYWYTSVLDPTPLYWRYKPEPPQL